MFFNLGKQKVFLFLFLLLFGSNKIVLAQFSITYSKFLNEKDFAKDQKTYIWECTDLKSFNELIMSWNAFRPKVGKFSFWISVKNGKWSDWSKIAEWGAKDQKTFSYSQKSFAQTKHVRVELKKNKKSNSFRIKVLAEKGADLSNLSALFVCLSDLSKFKIGKTSIDLPTTLIKGVPKQSQILLKHPRRRDLCSPTSVSMILNYFTKSSLELPNYATDFAKKVHDCYLDIYGNWILNMAQAYDSSNGNVFFKAQRLNDFSELYGYLINKIPVAVSIRGYLKGCAKRYSCGHFIVVVGWNNTKKTVLCIDPAFSSNSKTLRAYRIKDFLNAWGNSRNLSYTSIPKSMFC